MENDPIDNNAIATIRVCVYFVLGCVAQWAVTRNLISPGVIKSLDLIAAGLGVICSLVSEWKKVSKAGLAVIAILSFIFAFFAWPILLIEQVVRTIKYFAKPIYSDQLPRDWTDKTGGGRE